ncbi:MAG: hypothetical protein ACTHXA_06115 [Gulosibacter sp.]|uniref:hypothetical protein n=1 Tax=Gulosibacter sp. TaxID=2817531 RepID=UPI003F904DFB
MIITANDNGFTLDEPDDFSRLHVDAGGRTTTELTDLATSNVEVVPIADAEHLWIAIGFLRNGDSSEERNQQIARLVGYGEEHGWYDKEADAIRAHIENLAE